MKDLRKQIIKWAREDSDYNISKLYEIAPKFIEMVEEHIERSEWVSVTETKEEKLTSTIIELLKNEKLLDTI